MFDWCTDLVFFIFFLVVILTHLLGILRLKTLIVRGFRIQRHVDSICYVLFIYCFIYLYIYIHMFFTSQFWYVLVEIDQTGECIAGVTFGRFLGEVGNPTLEVQDC